MASIQVYPLLGTVRPVQKSREMNTKKSKRRDPMKRDKPSKHKRYRMVKVVGASNKTAWCYPDEVEVVKLQMGRWSADQQKKEKGEKKDEKKEG